jgi:hypothetical protein
LGDGDQAPARGSRFGLIVLQTSQYIEQNFEKTVFSQFFLSKIEISTSRKSKPIINLLNFQENFRFVLLFVDICCTEAI